MCFLPGATDLHQFGADSVAFACMVWQNQPMELFRQQLKQEFLKRTAKNEKYSLRAFAAMLEINHATLSGMLAGKRSVTKGSAVKIAGKLGWGPEVLLAHREYRDMA